MCEYEGVNKLRTMQSGPVLCPIQTPIQMQGVPTVLHGNNSIACVNV